MRNTVVVVGDFQAEVTPHAPLVGRSTCQTPFHVGADALDPGDLNTFLDNLGLVALNTWRGPATPTQYNLTGGRGAGKSQIDFILTRAISADWEAKNVKVTAPPIGNWRRHVGHLALHTTIRLMNHHMLPKRSTNPQLDRHKLDHEIRNREEGAHTLQLALETALNALTDPTPANINSTLLDTCQNHYPMERKPNPPPNPIVQHLWQKRREAEYVTVRPPREPERENLENNPWWYFLSRLFRGWKATVALRKQVKIAEKQCKEKKREDILQLLQKAEQAADNGDQRTVYQVVRRLAPWQPRQRVMIKDPSGRLLTLQQEHEALVSYSEDLFAPDTEQPAREEQGLNLVFTVEEIESQLKSIKIGKAVPPGVAPASVWRLAAPQVARLLKMAFDQHSHQPGITLPLQWTDAWIVWLPKPGKDPCEPSSLRPIGLMSPDAKALAGLLKIRLYELLRPQLRRVPQFAYQPGRDLYDALARVQVWIDNFKRCYGRGNSSKFAQRDREENPDNTKLCVGGAILSLDLKQAFDRVNRQALAQSLKDLGAGESMTAEIISLLDTSRYHIISDQEQSTVGTTRGIRQGCKIAPMLWVAISTLLLERLGDALSGPHRQATTFADDTLVQWLIENSTDIAQLSSFINKLLGVMQDMGLLVNLTKTVLLLKVCGPGARRALKDYVVYKDGKKWWRARHPDGSEALIPIACYTTYLGTHLSLQTEAHKVVGYRIAEANKRTGKIKKATRSRKVFGLAHRVRIWQACAASSATFGLIAFAPSAKAVALLRGWFYRQLRAVADSPAHISHETNKQLRQRLGVQDPIDATVQRIRHKLDKLRVAEASIINQPQTLQYWESMLQQYLIFHTENIDAEPDSRLIPVPAQQSQPVACPVCGVYFPSNKTMRQHRGRVHKVYVSSRRHDDDMYQQQDHSAGGMPQCIHCGLKTGSWDALRNHILNNVCGWQMPPGPTREAEQQDIATPPRGQSDRDPRIHEDTHPSSTIARQQPVQPAQKEPTIPLLRRPEVAKQLLQSDSKLQIVRDHARSLIQHCGFCGQWIAKGGSVKEHIKRMHSHIWHASIGNLDTECAMYKSHLTRDSVCDLCEVMVYQPDRHTRSCTVIFQTALATAWHKVGAPDTAPVARDVRTCITDEFLARQLNPDVHRQGKMEAGDSEVIDMLTRHCGLCLQRLTNQQDWRRHCANQHKEAWKRAEGFAELEVANMWGQHSPMELIMRDRPTEEENGEGRKFRRREGKGPGKAKREPIPAPNQQLAKQVQVLTKYVSQHAMALQLLEADRSWVLWMDSGAMGIIPQLVKTTATWKASREQNKCTCSLRQALLGSLLLELQARLAKMEGDKAAQAPLIQRKMLVAEPMAWSYTRWNPDKKLQEPREGNLLSHQDAKEAVQLLMREAVKPNVIQRFHALGGVKEDRPGATTFVLTVSLDADARPNINKALHALTETAATALIGARIRPERSHKPLPEDLQRAIDATRRQ
ncbi:unnamed protein product [Symbiodinium natans]|uniref:Reverse transcriptase domain-containing protein n=1 Tax=Symbiodinium natans TaxID=878477 RepID=A0A812RXU8_9DINO|nr:unnamed protein product [Symbiodinium natans]